MRKAVLIGAAVCVTAAAGYGYYRYTRKAQPPTVSTARVTVGDVVDAVGATGTLQAVTTVQVGSQVSGTVMQLDADFNSLVRKGQVIARLEPSLFQAQIDQSRANLVRAQADLQRLRVAADDARVKLRRAEELAVQKLIAQADLEAAQVAAHSADAQVQSQQAAVTQAEASLKQSQVNLAHTIISAPIDGLVISRNVDVGQTVAASMSAPTLFVLAADLTKMQVIASLDESDVGRIRPGQTVHFRVDAYPEEDFTGSVTQLRLQPQTVQNVVTYSTVIDVPNPQLKLKPGMTANVSIEIARRNGVLRVPNSALRFRPTATIFAALGQTPPTDGSASSGRSLGSRNSAPQSQSQGAAAPSEAPPAANAPPQGAAAAQDGAERSSAGRGRGNFASRMANMTPEERQQALERMRARGFTPPDAGGAEQDKTAPPQAASQTPATSGATTIDALFGPLPAVETSGQVWVFRDGALASIALRLGITDGQQTEILRGELKEGDELVTSVTISSQSATTSTSGTSPTIFGQPNRGGFPAGGFPAGGNTGGGNRGTR